LKKVDKYNNQALTKSIIIEVFDEK